MAYKKKVYQKSFESLLFKVCTYRFVPTCGLWKHPSVISSLHGESRQMQSVLVSSSRSTNTQRASEDDPHSSVLCLLDIFRPVKPQQPESEVIERQTGRDGNSSSDQRDGTKHSSRWNGKFPWMFASVQLNEPESMTSFYYLSSKRYKNPGKINKVGKKKRTTSQSGQ